MANPTLPGPSPWPPAGAATEIHVAEEVAVHAQPSVTLTPTLMLSADEGIAMPLLESVALHNACGATAASCVTVKVRPAMAMTPVRCVDVVFAATVYWTVPLPVPDPPPVTVIHGALLVAVHVQAMDPATVIAPLDPLAGTVTDTGDSVIAHP